MSAEQLAERDVVPFLARSTVQGHILYRAHTSGRAAALAEMTDGYRGGTIDIGDDRGWFEVKGRKVHIRLFGSAEPDVSVPCGTVLDWALARFTPADMQRLAELHAARAAGHKVIEPDTAAWHRQTYTPSLLTDGERARIARGWRMVHEANREILQLVRDRVSATTAAGEAAAGSWEQLELFDVGATR